LLADLNEEGLRETAASIGKAGGRGAVLAGDVTDSGFPARALDLAQSEFGRIDGCVPAAGIIRIRAIAEVTRAEWEAVLGLNLTSVFFLDRAVAEAAKAFT
jgi:NAD(P)-dependent dehydrogenase (short-subunit alcohol dehydrogenase family)